MGRNKQKNNPKRRISDYSDCDEQEKKAGKFMEEDISVSKLLGEANSVLYDTQPGFNDDYTSLSLSFGQNNEIEEDTSETFEDKDSSTQKTNMASSERIPTNYDIMVYLKKLDEKLSRVDKKVEKLESLEKKMSNFEKEIAKMWNSLSENNRKADERMIRMEEKIESVDFSLGVNSDKLVQLERERDSLKDEVVYLQSQSMRNNLVFANIPEAPRGIPEDCEKEIRSFIVEKLKVAQDLVDKITFERVHRIGQRSDGRTRQIVAKFAYFKDKEMVRRQGKQLGGTNFYVYEQFPKEVVEKRKQLLPKLKAARRDNKKAWLSYDTLYIDGKPVRENNR